MVSSHLNDVPATVQQMTAQGAQIRLIAIIRQENLRDTSEQSRFQTDKTYAGESES